ncbi:MAG: phosphate ABC transporter permease subunit PstC [Anaerolineae bacterium]
MQNSTHHDDPTIGTTLADQLAGTGGQKRGNILSPQVRPLDGVVSTFLFLCATVSILTTIGFIIVLGTESLRFFSTTEWLNTNKRTEVAYTADQTTLTIPTSGSTLAEGDVIRFGVAENGEQAQIVNVIDPTTIEVVRGYDGTEAIAHPPNTTLYRGAEATLGKFLTETRWAPQIGNFGILPLLTSTLRVAGIAMFVFIPIGLATAVYLSEYASERVRRILKPILEILAGVPTVVYGYFALTFVTPILRSIFGTDVVEVYNVASAGIVVGILIIPTISSISEDALRAVPNALREASYGLGATRLETVGNVLVPSALSGISAAIILGISRAVGETMIVLIAAGAGPSFTANNFKAAETMAGHIARISTGDLSFGSIDYNSVFAIGLTLFLMTLLLNFVSTLITRRFREVYS